MRRDRSLVVSTLLTAMLVGLTSPANADFRRSEDGSDTRGPLDIKWVRQGHDYGKIRYGLSTLGDWSERDLRRGRFIFSFDIDHDAAFERFVIVHWRDREEAEGGKLVSPVKNSKRNVIGDAGVAHWRGNMLRIWVARRHLEKPTRYRMTVSSEWRSRPCESSNCIDEGPEFAHRLWPLCDGLDPTVIGTRGDDTLHGTSKWPEVFHGRSGDDLIEKVDGYEAACGGSGHDVIVGNRWSNYFFGGTGNDVLYGRHADSGECPRGSDGDRRNGCVPPLNELRGGRGDDRLYGGPDYDVLQGGRGYDFLDGRQGDDRCNGGEVEQRC